MSSSIGKRHTVLSPPRPLTYLSPSPRSESVPELSVVAPLSSAGPAGGSPNAICVTIMGCVLDSLLEVQPLSLVLKA